MSFLAEIFTQIDVPAYCLLPANKKIHAMDNVRQHFEPDNQKFRNLLLGSLGVVVLFYVMTILYIH